MGSNSILLAGLVGGYLIGIYILRLMLQPNNILGRSVYALILCILVIVGVAPSIILEFGIIEETALTVSLAILYFISFICVGSYLFIRKLVVTQKS